MKLSLLHTLLLIFTSVASTIASAVYGRREIRRLLDTSQSEYTSLDTRGAQIVPAVILGVAIGSAIGGSILHHFKTKPEATVKPDSSNPNESAILMMQEAVNYLSQNSIFTAMAVRSGIPVSIGFEGTFGEDWGSSAVTIDANEGTSKWVFYWAKTGSLTITTPDMVHDIVLGGSTQSNRDANNYNQWKFTIIPH